MNELIFVLHIIIIGIFTLAALALGRTALVALICTQALLANVFVLKQISLFGWNATATDAFTVGATIGISVLQEYYGASAARKTIGFSLFVLIFYALISQIHIAYLPCAFDVAHTHYATLFAVAPRLAIASLTAYGIAQLTNSFLYQWFATLLPRRLHVVRTHAAVLISQLIDTVLFCFLGLYGIMNEMWQIIFISYTIKVAVIFLATPFVWFSKKIPFKKN